MRPVKSPLTAREWEVIDLLKAATTTDQIADELVLSTETVRSHVKNILRKLDVRSREEAVVAADRMRSAPRGDEPPPTAAGLDQAARRSSIQKVLPLAAPGSTPIAPPRRSMSRAQMVSPRPMPGTRRSPGTRWNGWKIRSASSAGIGMPPLATETRQRSAQGSARSRCGRRCAGRT